MLLYNTFYSVSLLVYDKNKFYGSLKIVAMRHNLLLLLLLLRAHSHFSHNKH